MRIDNVRKYDLPADAGKVNVTIVSDTHTAIEYTTATNPKGRMYHEILGNWILKSQIGEVLTLINKNQND